MAGSDQRVAQVKLKKDEIQVHNILVLHFESAKLHAKKLEAQYGVRRGGSCNLSDPSRLYVRKAQYQWR
jgi:beta-mannosidase